MPEYVESPFVWMIKQVPKGYEADTYRLYGPVVEIGEEGDVSIVCHDHIATVTHMYHDGDYIIDYVGYAENIGSFVIGSRSKVPEMKKRVENRYIKFVRAQSREFSKLAKMFPRQVDPRTEAKRLENMEKARRKQAEKRKQTKGVPVGSEED